MNNIIDVSCECCGEIRSIAIKHKKEKIIRTANNLYNEILKADNPKPLIQKIRPVCFDFNLLEQKCNEFSV